MNVTTLGEQFQERLQEIEAYMELLDAIERQVGSGETPEIRGAQITPLQQKILYSSVYLQLYNLVEATVTWCMDAVAAAAADGKQWRAADLTDHLRREWVRVLARTHVELTGDHRLDAAMFMFERIALLASAQGVVARKGRGRKLGRQGD